MNGVVTVLEVRWIWQVLSGSVSGDLQYCDNYKTTRTCNRFHTVIK